jgi:predicted RNase H-like HicB family nuclease
MKLPALFVKVPEGYVAFVEELPGANTQGETLEEARENLTDAATLVLEANRMLAEQSLMNFHRRDRWRETVAGSAYNEGW